MYAKVFVIQKTQEGAKDNIQLCQNLVGQADKYKVLGLCQVIYCQVLLNERGSSDIFKASPHKALVMCVRMQDACHTICKKRVKMLYCLGLVISLQCWYNPLNELLSISYCAVLKRCSQVTGGFCLRKSNFSLDRRGI